MNCPKCNAILDDDSKFCVSCGAQLGGEVNPNNEVKSFAVPAVNEKKPASKGKALSLIVGTLFILIGIIKVLSAGTTISSTSFGGDFYTYTYQGIVAISELLASIESSLGWIIAAIGAAIDVNALRR